MDLAKESKSFIRWYYWYRHLITLYLIVFVTKIIYFSIKYGELRLLPDQPYKDESTVGYILYFILAFSLICRIIASDTYYSVLYWMLKEGKITIEKIEKEEKEDDNINI